MKKLLSVFLAAIMILSLSLVAFAAGSREEEMANIDIREYCTNCANECTGMFGCNCCEDCPGYMDEKGNATNISGYLECRFGYYLDSDIIEDGNVVHKGDNKVHYYWKAKCCDDCTGKVGCKCNCKNGKEANCPYCIDEDANSNVGDKVEGGIHAAQNGFISGIQKALTAVRDVMYELFDALFEFLRLEDLLGKLPPITK